MRSLHALQFLFHRVTALADAIGAYKPHADPAEPTKVFWPFLGFYVLDGVAMTASERINAILGPIYIRNDCNTARLSHCASYCS